MVSVRFGLIKVILILEFSLHPSRLIINSHVLTWWQQPNATIKWKLKTFLNMHSHAMLGKKDLGMPITVVLVYHRISNVFHI